MSAVLDRREAQLERPRLPGAASLVVLVSLVVLALSSGVQPGLWRASAIALATCVVTVFITSSFGAAGLFRPVNAYIFVLAMFHLGLAPYFLLNVKPPAFGSFLNSQLLNDPFLPRAILLASAGIGAVGVGAVAVDVMSTGRGLRFAPTATDIERRRVERTGLVLLVSGVGAWAFVGVTRLGVGFILSPYTTWLAATGGTPLPYAYFAIGIGFTFIVVGQGRLFTSYSAPFWLYFIGGMALGLRNEVMVPAAVALSVNALLGRRPSGRVVVLGLAIGLVALGGVREARETGVQLNSLVPTPRYASDALAEMGYSVRTIVIVERWLVEGDELLGGTTYWAPVERLVANVVGDIEPVPVGQDERDSSSLVRRREGPVGFSSIAEALRNFSANSATVVLLFQGALLGFLERRAVTLRRLLLLAVVLSSLLFHARNSFTPVPFQLAAGGILILVACPPRWRAR